MDFAGIFRRQGQPRDKTQEYAAQLARFRREFGSTNGTKWFCEGVPYAEALRRHEKLKPQFSGLFRRKAGMPVQLQEAQQGTEPANQVTCPECGETFPTDDPTPALVTCPKCGAEFAPGTEPKEPETAATGDAFTAMFRRRPE